MSVVTLWLLFAFAKIYCGPRWHRNNAEVSHILRNILELSIGMKCGNQMPNPAPSIAFTILLICIDFALDLQRPSG